VERRAWQAHALIWAAFVPGVLIVTPSCLRRACSRCRSLGLPDPLRARPSVPFSVQVCVVLAFSAPALDDHHPLAETQALSA